MQRCAMLWALRGAALTALLALCPRFGLSRRVCGRPPAAGHHKCPAERRAAGRPRLVPFLTRGRLLQVDAEAPPDQKRGEPAGSEQLDADEVTSKYGLEAGLWKAFRSKEGGVTAQELLKRYGAAYLLTSITFALISFALCYLAVERGVDVGSLLARINISVGADSAGEKAGTAALAYAAHKALSPVRFPPTVVLTPVVANWLKRGPVKRSDGPDA